MSEKFVYPASMLKSHRSGWKMPHRWKGSFMHGDLVCFDVLEVLPGDTFSLDLAALIRMSTPIAPIMDDVVMHFAAYFVPNRVSFENWEELCGVNKTGAWTTGMSNVVVPHLDVGSQTPVGSTPVASFHTSQYGTLSDFYEMCVGNYVYGVNKIAAHVPTNILPLRDYYLIHNYHYRSSVVSSPIAVDRSSNNNVIVGEGITTTLSRKCEPLGKYPDYFTKCLPEAQFGNAVQFLSDLVPVHTGSGSALPTGSQVELQIAKKSDGNALYGDYFLKSYSGHGTTETATGGAGTDWVPANLFADFSQSLKTINDLRYAFQLQKFLEKDARYGVNRSYREYLNAHFGVTIAESVVQQPQFLGEFNFKINIDQVLSTAGYVAGTTSTVGAPGANSVTGKKEKLFTFSSAEHGYILIVGGARANQTYTAGMNRIFNHINKLDFYHPEFSSIGEMLVKNSELNVSGNFYVGFGYQECWAEYRYVPDRCVGLLKPGVTGALDFWTLANDCTQSYTLNESFIYEGRQNIARALVTGTKGPDYIGDIYFDLKVSRVMPAYSIPGFADHH